MKNMTIKNIIEACKGDFRGLSVPESEITGVTIDSRQLEPGNLFIATRGEKVDGHSFINEAVKKGALAVVCEEVSTASIPYIIVKDSLKALKDIAIFYRRQLEIPVIGITGSVGKTSTKEFIATVLSTRYKVFRTAGNKNNEIGLPLMILKIRAEHQAAVLEMGINDFGEMHRLSEMARPDIAVMTNIGDCHLERLKDRTGVLKAKSEIFDFLSADGNVVINGDDELLFSIPVVNEKAPIKFGNKADNDIIAEQIENLGLDGTKARVKLKYKNEAFDIRIPLPGEHMIYNALAATAVADLLGLSGDEVKAGLLNLKSVPGRSNIIRMPAGIIIDDCYNANPVSMKSALMLLKSAPGRKVAILGDMGELGVDERGLHAGVGREAITAGADILVCIGKLSLYMYNAAMVANEINKLNRQVPCKIYHFVDKESFLAAADNIIEADDTVLIKASHSMAFETLVGSLMILPVFE